MSTRLHDPRLQPGPRPAGIKDQIIERFERKYIVHPCLLPRIREFVRQFCVADSAGVPAGPTGVPEYTVTTMQLDTAGSDLVLAKENKADHRFKLRIRTYGTDVNPANPVFFEIKRKSGGVIVKSRARSRRGDYSPGMVLHPDRLPILATEKDNANLMEFSRLCLRLGARPRMLIRYVRESWIGENDDYARVTVDRRLRYRPTDSWELPSDEAGTWLRWRSMDTQTALKTPFSGHVLELKSMRDVPSWMLELVERFDLVPVGFCKYATAHRLEGLHRGRFYTAAGENTTL